MNDQQRASQTVMSPEALMPRASAIGARPLLVGDFVHRVLPS